VIFGQLGAEPEPKAVYREMEGAPAFARPILWSAIDAGAYDALFLAGGHAPGMCQYLGSEASSSLFRITCAQRPRGA
jgi:hypothetical protein